MSARTVSIVLDLTPTEASALAVLEVQFGLSEEEIVASLFRYGLNLTQLGGPADGKELIHFLDQKVSGHQAILEEIDAVLGRLRRTSEGVDIAVSTVLSRTAKLPDPRQITG
jgi:hypothetical protein